MLVLLFIKWVFRAWNTFWTTRKNFDLNFGIVKGATKEQNTRKFSFGMIVATVSRDYVEIVSDPEDEKVQKRLEEFANTVFKVFYTPPQEKDNG